MTPEQEQKVLASLYDRLHDAVTYSPDGKSGAFPKNVYFQMAKNQVLNPDDFSDMLSPVNPNGDQTSAEYYSDVVDHLPAPGALWSDSGGRVSSVVTDILAQANTASKPSEEQVASYKLAYDFLWTKTTMTDAKGKVKERSDPSDIALAYDDARDAYIAAIAGYRTAYNGYDLEKKEDQRQWNAASPALLNLVNSSWNKWTRAGKAEVEEAQQILQSSINDAITHAISEQKRLSSDLYQLPSATPAGHPWLPSYATPTNWADPAAKGIKLSFSSAYLNKTETTSGHTYGLEGAGSYGLFHASVGVEGSHEEKHAHMDAENLTLEAELMAVNVVRPWFNPLLFGMSGWWVSGYGTNTLSNGDSKNPVGKIPLIPTGFVVARNVSIAADFSQEDKKFISNSVDTKASGGWGPFSISGKYGYKSSNNEFQSKFDGGKLVFPGLQLIAWISTVTPASPPMNSH